MTANSKVAFITGGNRGIGLAIANKFKADGYQVVVSHRSGAAPVGLDGVIMDVTDSESVNAAVASIEGKYGQIDVLVANAGITKDGLVMRMSDEDFEAVVETNLIGAFKVARACTRGMLKRKSGRMIFVGSVVGMLGSAGQVNYAATKSGLIGMARSFARELGSRGITANVVAPGFVDTDMTAVLDEARKAEIIGAVPLARFCSPEEVAGVVAFLASPEAAYISGAVIPVDGGLGMGH
ncbi:MAG: SDR family oxidoreductase [Actinomycetales bacterium]|jgi:3-oxoacyl-[acyl-carrier protein] reductase|nr:MAG: SDR family oxidoreductase [Actinomycetales bacterium]